jgi:hypothetical protein
MLDAFCLATGYHRKYAIAVLRGRWRVAVRRRGARTRRYGPEFQRALLVAWEASGYVCSERLQPFLPELVSLLEQHQHLSVDDATRDLLLQASVSTVERTLAPKRKGLVGRRMAQTKPGTLLRRQIPALVGPWKAEDVPGYLEIDLVSHSGEYAAGTFLYTLSTVDLATGWTERIALLGKGQTGVVAGLDRIREQLPFRLRSLHPDTGSEFINFHLFDYCKDRGIEFTRSRPYHKNDNCPRCGVRRIRPPSSGFPTTWGRARRGREVRRAGTLTRTVHPGLPESPCPAQSMAVATIQPRATQPGR